MFSAAAPARRRAAALLLPRRAAAPPARAALPRAVPMPPLKMLCYSAAAVFAAMTLSLASPLLTPPFCALIAFLPRRQRRRRRHTTAAVRQRCRRWRAAPRAAAMCAFSLRRLRHVAAPPMLACCRRWLFRDGARVMLPGGAQRYTRASAASDALPAIRRATSTLIFFFFFFFFSLIC